MEKIAIMTDTNSGILPKEAKELGIFLLQMPFVIDGELFYEYGSITHDEFFHRLGAGSKVSTSQPSPSELCENWDKILCAYDKVIYIPMSSALSGTCQTAKTLSLDYDERVLVADNKRISVTLKAAVLDALKMSKEGKSAETIVNYLENSALNCSIYITPSTLEFLKKGGRITPSGAAIGSILGIKPVLQIRGEKLDAYKKVRGINAAMDTMLCAAENDIKTRFYGKKINIRTAYTGSIQKGEEWRLVVSEKFRQFEVGLEALPISISCHLGPGAIGISVCEEY